MIDPPEQTFHFARTDFGPGKLKRHGAAQTILGGTQPGTRIGKLAESLSRLAEQPREPDHLIRFVRAQATRQLAAVQRGTSEPEVTREPVERKIELSLQ